MRASHLPTAGLTAVRRGRRRAQEICSCEGAAWEKIIAAMKNTGVCPKCSSERVMRIEVVADAADWTGSGGGPMEQREGGAIVPRRVLEMRSSTSGLFGGKSDSFRSAGEVEAYACADCGYFEEYLRNVRAIQWDAVVGASPYKPRSGR
jgi:ribosomal protein L37AE/L43A